MNISNFATRALARWLFPWAERKMFSRLPDVCIGGDDTYMFRWYVVPRNRLFNVYLHVYRRSDDDRAPHDHPWVSASLMLRGSFSERVFPEGTPEGGYVEKIVRAGDLVLRSAKHTHMLALRQQEPVADPSDMPVTLFVTGPKVREWGFVCPKSTPAGGWRSWRQFTAGKGGETVGLGCD
jgi:hypothetical protein